MTTKLVFHFAEKPHTKLMLERAFTEHGAGAVELPATLYNPMRGLKMFGLSRNRRYCWLPAHEPASAGNRRIARVENVRAVITRKRGKWSAVMQPLMAKKSLRV